MKKSQFSIFAVLTVLFAGFLIGFSVGRNSDSADVIVSVPTQMYTKPPVTVASTEEITLCTETILFPININTADKEEFMALPGIGEVLAGRILAYREEHGNFSHVTQMMNVEGIGQTRMEIILDYVTIGG